MIPVEWPAKAKETDFGAFRSMHKHRTASSSNRPKNHQNARRGQSANTGIFPVEWPAKAKKKRLWCDSVHA